MLLTFNLTKIDQKKSNKILEHINLKSTNLNENDKKNFCFQIIQK